MRLIAEQSVAFAALVGLSNGLLFDVNQTCLDIKGNVSSSSAVITTPRESACLPTNVLRLYSRAGVSSFLTKHDARNCLT
jgi:hypothetical protein